MPNLVRTWTQQPINNALDVSSLLNYHNATILAFKKFIAGQFPVDALGAWTVDSSSNGTVAGAGDHWATTADLVHAAAGVAHSWAVFKSPAGYVPGGNFVYILMALDSAADQQITWKVSGANFTGGTTTANPTTIATPAGFDTSQIFLNVLPVGSTWNATRSTFGDFIFLVGRVGDGFPQTALCSFSLVNPRNGDGYPVATVAIFQNAANGGLQRGVMQTGHGLYALWANGNAVTGPHYVTMPRDVGDSTSWLNNSVSGYDGIDGSLLPGVPCDLCSNDGGGQPASFRGTLPDLYLVQGAIPIKTPTPSAAPLWTCVGGYLAPFSVSPNF
jgi:hypothetical protein